MLVRKEKIIVSGEVVGREERGGCTLPDAAKGSTVLLASPFLSRQRRPMNSAYHETVFVMKMNFNSDFPWIGCRPVTFR